MPKIIIICGKLGRKAEDRLTQLAGSVLQNGFSGYRRDVQGGEIIWDVHHRSPGFSPDTVGKSAVMPSRVLSTTEAINPPSASPLAAAPALAFRGKGASPRVANKKRDKRSAKLDESPFALLVLEGSITAVFESETGKGRVKHSIRREQVLEPGACLRVLGSMEDQAVRSAASCMMHDSPGLGACNPIPLSVALILLCQKFLSDSSLLSPMR